jgi:hypothetical protein
MKKSIRERKLVALQALRFIREENLPIEIFRSFSADELGFSWLLQFTRYFIGQDNSDILTADDYCERVSREFWGGVKYASNHNRIR